MCRLRSGDQHTAWEHKTSLTQQQRSSSCAWIAVTWLKTDSKVLDLPLCWPSEAFFLELCLLPPLSGRFSTSESDVRELRRPVWLDAFIRALFFLARSDSGAERVRSDSWFSGSEPTLTNAFLVLVKAEVTEPITEEKKRLKKKKASLEKRHSHPCWNLTPVFDKVARQIQQNKRLVTQKQPSRTASWQNQFVYSHFNDGWRLQFERKFIKETRKKMYRRHLSRPDVPFARHVTWRKLHRRRASPGAEQHQRTISPESHQYYSPNQEANWTGSNVPAGRQSRGVFFYAVWRQLSWDFEKKKLRNKYVGGRKRRSAC